MRIFRPKGNWHDVYSALALPAGVTELDYSPRPGKLTMRATWSQIIERRDLLAWQAPDEGLFALVEAAPQDGVATWTRARLLAARPR